MNPLGQTRKPGGHWQELQIMLCLCYRYALLMYFVGEQDGGLQGTS